MVAMIVDWFETMENVVDYFGIVVYSNLQRILITP
jgi:hypothetical protein